MSRMSNDEYQSTQKQIVRMANEIEQMDLSVFLDRIEVADTMGSILDPTLYMRAIDDMNRVKKLAKAFKNVQDVFKEIKSEVK